MVVTMVAWMEPMSVALKDEMKAKKMAEPMVPL